MAFPFLFVLGLALTVAAISAKSLRVGRLWYRIRERKQDKGIYYLLLIAAAVLAHLIVLLAWNFVAPLVFTRTITSVDINGFPQSSYGACLPSSSTTLAFMILELILLALYLVMTGLLTVWVHNAPEKFQDAKFTAIAACCLAQIYLLGVPVVIIIYELPLPRFLVISTLCFLTSIILFGFLFFPKVVRAHEERKSSNGNNGSAMGTPGGGTTGNRKGTSPRLGGTARLNQVEANPAKPTLLRFSPIPLAKRTSSLAKRKPVGGKGLPPSPPEDGDVRSKAKAHRSDFAAAGEPAQPNPSPADRAARPARGSAETLGKVLASSNSNSKFDGFSAEILSEVDDLHHGNRQPPKSALVQTVSADAGTSTVIEEMEKEAQRTADGRPLLPPMLQSQEESSFYNSSALNVLMAYEQILQQQPGGGNATQNRSDANDGTQRSRDIAIV